MKRLNFFDKLVFLLNSLAGTLLLLSYILPFLPPKSFSVLAVLSLAVPFLLLLNLIFFIYWLAKLKRQFILSLFVMALGYTHIKSSFNFNSNDNSQEKGIEIMSYNVHLLNLYKWIDADDIPEKIHDFIINQSPAIVCIQEYESSIATDLNYPYVFRPQSNSKSELVIFSKYKFVNSGVINFPSSANRAVFIDVKIKSDTLRIYNLHLQSTGINTDVRALDSQQSDRMFNQLSSTFTAQQVQAELMATHMRKSPHKIVLCGDFNNTAHSYVYRLLKSNLEDTFEVAGNGFGGTYNFDYFPLRIDFILTDPSIEILNFKNYAVEFSDHYPICTALKIK